MKENTDDAAKQALQGLQPDRPQMTGQFSPAAVGPPTEPTTGTHCSLDQNSGRYWETAFDPCATTTECAAATQ